jgi:hypothetical protein
MVTSGRIEQGPTLPEEADDIDIAELPRLYVPFDRQRYGRLMQMIHRINELGNP